MRCRYNFHLFDSFSTNRNGSRGGTKEAETLHLEIFFYWLQSRL